ncbi:MAG: BolA family transcriptional regulator [Kangiellaceae bacterium]|nr:BolA family transcriptional regulator [Kangiellaceae bacterium]
MSNSEIINAERVIRIRQMLTEQLTPSFLAVTDESHLHAGHAGAQTGKGHFFVEVSCDKFTGLTPIKKHQLIYQSLGDMMQMDIHALRISIKK